MVLNLVNTTSIALHPPVAAVHPSRLTRLLRLVIPRRHLCGSSLVNDATARRRLRQIESFGYRVQVWRNAGDQSLWMSAENDWAMSKHTVKVSAGVADEAAGASALVEEVAVELEE
jgi:hypothetical protein